MDWTEIFTDATVAAVGPVAAAYAMAALGLNLQFGYAGLLNFGHVGFMLMGSYGLAITVDYGGSYWLGLVVGLLAAMALGLILGVPTLRLRADYLAIVTISAAEILRLLVRAQSLEGFTGGTTGFQAFADPFFSLNPFEVNDRFNFLGLTFSGRQLWVMIVAWILVFVVALLLRRVMHSPWGRVMRAIREDEDAVRSVGKNVFWFKLQSLMIGGALGGLGGIIIITEQQAVTPDLFTPRITFFLYVIVILGGAGTIWGPIIGSCIFQFLLFFFDGLMTDLQSNGRLPSSIDSSDAQQIKLVLVGAGLMALMSLRPQGIFGSREEQMIGER